MNFDIAPTSPIPIYKQIVEQVRRMVASGQLKPGDDLPSVRAVALHHAINPMTVSKAYSMLETEGLLTRRRGVGMAVADAQPAMSARDKAAMLRPALQAAAQTARQLGYSPADALRLFEQCLNDTPTKEDHD
ncbi:GntR family transcriptional regulator [Pseudoduganella namucuonensis]|uniref:Transcriptional regulator, GntR family n=1 Tax=Pseudoduganella namucuonensis TaxID=1035707 RepID=A0A1I7FKY0_9BURK|nr:GntR family transcriptional regulator [Pseudoduganella namucuonensis]SFU36814.1 transcriptional regulator, GntR family [Pseudoduganella namucuonensis]